MAWVAFPLPSHNTSSPNTQQQVPRRKVIPSSHSYSHSHSKQASNLARLIFHPLSGSSPSRVRLLWPANRPPINHLSHIPLISPITTLTDLTRHDSKRRSMLDLMAHVPSDPPHTPLPNLPPAPAPPTSFYQRQLPPSCVSFTSAEGKTLFRSALAADQLESFFPLASQLVTQHDPSFCGLATLCTVLNALGVDPKRVWRHPWRWYEQDMLDCCRPLDSIRNHGITLAEFNCLARCNGLALTTRSPAPAGEAEPEGRDGLAEFRAAVAEATGSASTLMAVSFCRATLGQTGTGHFSPVAAYAPAEDRVLVLDVARFKYPSYWVRLADLYDSMRPLDPATGRPRGYTLLRYSPLLDLSCQACQPAPPSATRITLNKSSWAVLSRALEPTRAALAHEPLPAAVAALVASLGSGSVPPIEVRPGSEALAKDLFSLISQLSIALPAEHPPEPLATLFALALLNPNPETLAVPDLLKHELTYLKAQLDALGECCQIEVGGSGGELGQENVRGQACGCKKTK